MTRLEKCRILKLKGYSYDPETGKIYGIRGKEIITKNKDGYIRIRRRDLFQGDLASHHFAWYCVYGDVNFIELDHKDNNPSNNKIDNLRISNRNQQNQNRKFKGCWFDKIDNKWRSQITINGKQTFLGRFDTEEEARNAYLEAKKIYHII